MSAVTERRRIRRREQSALDPHSSMFHAFADMLYAGVLIFGLSLMVVTWFAAFSAGVQALREARESDRHVTSRAVWAAFLNRISRHPLTHVLAPSIVTTLLVVDVVLLPYVAPGSFGATVLPIVLAAALGAIALRVAGTWRQDRPARASLAMAWRRMSTDAGGSALLALAVAAAGAVVMIAPMLLIVMPGPLALAAVAMDRDRGVPL